MADTKSVDSMRKQDEGDNEVFNLSAMIFFKSRTGGYMLTFPIVQSWGQSLARDTSEGFLTKFAIDVPLLGAFSLKFYTQCLVEASTSYLEFLEALSSQLLVGYPQACYEHSQWPYDKTHSVCAGFRHQ